MPGKRYDRQFKLSAARLVLEGEIPVKGLSDQLNVPCCTLRRWAAEYEADSEDAFPGSGNPVANKDYEILKLKKACEALEPFVEDIFYANNRRYGSRRIVVELRKIGIVANGKTVQRMMARKGLVSCRGPRKYRRGGKASDKGANVLSREFSVQKRNSVWRGDIACTPTREGRLYLATCLDLFSCKIVGWQVSPASMRIW